MLRSSIGRLFSPLTTKLEQVLVRSNQQAISARNLSSRSSSSKSSKTSLLLADAQEVPHNVELEDMPFLHHGDRPRFWNYQKFKSPQKRASKLLHDLEQEQIEQMKKANPGVWNTQFRVGDAIEIKIVGQGGVNSEKYERVRGVVLGRVNRGLSTTVLIRDMLTGLPIERSMALFSPLIKGVKLLEKNYVFKGRKKIKRAKLYYLRGRALGLCNVSKYYR